MITGPLFSLLDEGGVARSAGMSVSRAERPRSFLHDQTAPEKFGSSRIFVEYEHLGQDQPVKSGV